MQGPASATACERTPLTRPIELHRRRPMLVCTDSHWLAASIFGPLSTPDSVLTAGDSGKRRIARIKPANQLGPLINHQRRRHQRRRRKTIQVIVRDNNVEQALKVLKKKLQREGVFREMRRRRAYEKPSERRARQASEAVRRSRKLARKLAQREGLIAKPAARGKRK